MKKVLKINSKGYFIEDIILQDGDQTPTDCIETQCQGGFYKPRWNGTSWVEGLTQEEINNIIANQPINVKAQAINEINQATTIASLKLAMLNYINAE